jgi:hypothetical protein
MLGRRVSLAVRPRDVPSVRRLGSQIRGRSAIGMIVEGRMIESTHAILSTISSI